MILLLLVGLLLFGVLEVDLWDQPFAYPLWNFLFGLVAGGGLSLAKIQQQRVLKAARQSRERVR